MTRHTGGPVPVRPGVLAAAGGGLLAVWRREPNLRFQLFAGYTALAWDWLDPLPSWATAAVIGAIALVVVSEIMNSAVEAAVDLTTTAWHPVARLAKDLAAGAVLAASACALALGVWLYWPHVAALPSVLARAAGGRPFEFWPAAAIWLVLGWLWVAAVRHRRRSR